MRSPRRLTCLVVILLTLGVNAFAQSFAVTDFRDTSGFVYVNVPTTSAVLDLTPGGALRPTVGAIWRRERVPISGSWTSTIRFQITDTGGAPDPSGRNGADGLAFVVQLESPEAIGSTGYGLGYHGIRGGMAVEVDTWDDSAEPIWNGATEDRADHVALMTNGRAALSSVPMFSAVTLSRVVGDVSDGAVHTLAVRATPGMIRVYLDDCTVPLIVWPVAVDTLLAPTAFIGITAATQSAWQRHKVVSWCFSTAGLCGCPVPCDVDTVYVPSPPVHDTTVVYRDTGRVEYRTDTLYIRTPPDTVTVTVERWRFDTTVVRVPYAVHDTTVIVRVDSVPYPVHDTTRVVEYRDTCESRPPVSALDTICGGGTRSMALNLFVTRIISVAPNPTPGAVAITFELGDRTDYGLYIYDARGALRYALIEQRSEPGRYRMTTDLSRLDAGAYYVVLRDPRGVRSAPLEIRR